MAGRYLNVCELMNYESEPGAEAEAEAEGEE